MVMRNEELNELSIQGQNLVTLWSHCSSCCRQLWSRGNAELRARAGWSSPSAHPHGNYLQLFTSACSASRGGSSRAQAERAGSDSPHRPGQALPSVPRALAQLPPALARWQRTSSVLALPCLPGLGALCQLGLCQGSNSSPPNSRAEAASSSARPILTLSLLPLSHSTESPLFCHRASRRVE